jgi:uncharacterized membrane protein
MVSEVESRLLSAANNKHRDSEEMAAMLAFAPRPTPAGSRLNALVRRLPLFGSLLDNIDKTGKSFSGLAVVEENILQSLSDTFSGFQIAGLVIYAIDFFKIPAIFLAGLIKGENVPISLTQQAKSVYSGVLLALTITALALPFAAPPIALTVASLTLGFSLYVMGQTLYDRYQLNKKLRNINQTIATETQELDAIRLEVITLEAEIATAKSMEAVEQLRLQIVQKRKEFEQKYDLKKEHLQNLHDEKFLTETELHSIKTNKIMNTSVGISLAALAIIGLAVSLFFPPVGLAILGTSAGLSGLYIIAKISYPLIKKWITTASGSKDGIRLEPTREEESEDIDALSETNNDSTAITMKLLFGGEDGPALPTNASKHWGAELQTLLLKMVTHHDLKNALMFLKNAAHHIPTMASEMPTDDLRQFFRHFDEDDTPRIVELFKEAIAAGQNGTIELSTQDRKALLNCKPLKTVLGEYGINLDVLDTPQDVVDEGLTNGDVERRSDSEAPHSD